MVLLGSKLQMEGYNVVMISIDGLNITYDGLKLNGLLKLPKRLRFNALKNRQNASRRRRGSGHSRIIMEQESPLY